MSRNPKPWPPPKVEKKKLLKTDPERLVWANVYGVVFAREFQIALAHVGSMLREKAADIAASVAVEHAYQAVRAMDRAGKAAAAKRAAREEEG